MDIHKIGFGFIFPDWSGKFRLEEVEVGDYTPPLFFQVPQLIQTLSDDLTERLKHIPSQENQEQYLAEVISMAAWLQHRFIWIHPFKDYNGRVGRLLTNLLFLNLGLPVVEIKAETETDRERYIKAMKTGDAGNLDLLEQLISEALQESLVQSSS